MLQCLIVFLVYEQLLSTLSDPVCWVLQGWLHQRMGVAILIFSSVSLVSWFLLVLWCNIFLLSCRHNEIFLLLPSCSCLGNIWRCLWTRQIRMWSTVRSPCHLPYHSFFKIVFSRPKNILISLMFSPHSAQKESIHVSLVACCSLPRCLSFWESRLSLSINGSLIIECLLVDKIHAPSRFPEELSATWMLTIS